MTKSELWPYLNSLSVKIKTKILALSVMGLQWIGTAGLKESACQLPGAGFVKTYVIPWRPFKMLCLNLELKLIEECGIWNKGEF